MITDIFEKWQPSFQLQRREIVTITAATTAVIAAKTLYSLAQQFYGSGDCAVVPYTLPFVGSTREYRRDPQGFVEKWTKKFGPVYKMHIFGRITTVVSGSYVREIFLNNDFDFQLGMRRRFDVRLLMDINEHVETTRARQILLNHLHRNMKNYVPRVVKYLKMAATQQLGEMPDGTKTLPHVYPLMQHMIANATASIFVGENLCKDEKLIEVFKNVTLDVGAEIQTDSLFLDWFSTISEFRQWWIGKASHISRRYKRQLIEALKPEIAMREENKNKPGWERPADILQDLLETVPIPRGWDAASFLADYIIAFIFASIHTTSENSTVVMYRLLQHPELIPELLEEQKQVLKEELGEEKANSTQDVTSLFTFNVVRSMVKLDSLCRESMRLRNDYLALPHRYTGTKPVTLSNGVIIRPGEDIIINQWYNHRSAEIQKDKESDHNSFQPFRYVGLDRQSTKIGEDFLMFGMGAHACPGRWFALQEVKTIVSVFIREFEISAKDGVYFPEGDINKLPFGELVLKKRS